MLRIQNSPLLIENMNFLTQRREGAKEKKGIANIHTLIQQRPKFKIANAWQRYGKREGLRL
ncbi:hypothetical protein ACQFX9_00960 [Aliinostoc sp. HNIBRCY26]|uniref:hypothetical protein n=1 Tax=Aliinostoc sp. HNIBRCY26 TaxID=3418997 RepID=UPI003D02A63B